MPVPSQNGSSGWPACQLGAGARLGESSFGCAGCAHLRARLRLDDSPCPACALIGAHQGVRLFWSPAPTVPVGGNWPVYIPVADPGWLRPL